MNLSLKDALFPAIIDIYKSKITKDKIYVDKSHPNIWLVEDLIQYFPQAKFISIRRGLLDTVSSMMQHGLAMRGNDWYKFPIPNPFLGITHENLEKYKNSSLLQKCVYRWWSHEKRLDYISSWANVLNIKYEDLIEHHERTIKKLEDFLLVKIPLDIPAKECLGKHKNYLNDDQIRAVEETLEDLKKLG